ncbi:hypothetical protein B7463_g148, partial [Scytalidium lignicola]
MPKRPHARQEGRILLAINALKNNQIKSMQAAARSFDVPFGTLYDRMRGRPEAFTTYTKAFKMSQLEESSLVQWIISMGNRGMPPRPSGVHSIANALISKRGEPTPPSSLTTKYIRKYSYQRAKCEDPKLIQQWFNQFLETKAQYGILDEDIYNFDETGFAMGTIATTKVTVIESINTCGWMLPPLVIFKGKHYQLTLTNLLPDDWRIEWSDNGWTNNRIGLEWLEKTFELATKERTKGQYHMLVLDGHGSHIALEFDLFYSQHKIIPICMPPHSSYLLQLLDVTCFSVLKRAYGAQIESKVRGKIQHIDKEDFLELYPIVRQQTFKSTNIQSGFSATGLIPYEPEHVLSKLHVQVDKTLTPPGSTHSSNSRTRWIPETPHNSVQLRLQSETIQRLLKERNSPSTPAKTTFNQLVKGFELAIHDGVILTQEIEELRTADASLQQKLRRTRKRLVHTGSLTRQEAQELAQLNAIVQNVVEGSNPSTSINPLQAPSRRPPTCSGCGVSGHKITKCPQLASH